MVGVTDIALLSLTSGVVGTTLLVGLGVFWHTQDFAERVIWADHVTSVDKVRTLARYSLHETNWSALPGIVAKAFPIFAGVTATVTIFAIGLLEVIGV